MFSKDFHQFVESLTEAKAEYLIVGGYAVGFYGHPRYTGDMDIWINQTSENAKKVIKAIEIFGFSSLGITESDLLTPHNIIQMGNPPLRIDILTEIDGVAFDDCFARRRFLKVADLEFNFISYTDLVANKTASGRAKDLDDINHIKPRED
jgi:predicted nucleotidyltransferase